ncbi:MAG: DnaJ domain-containing protein [Eubacteriales bacterium]|nr:DnaJ domain-containing protein [Eubacteriales bacterium]
MLGLKSGADTQTVRAAYRRKVKECHPDQFEDAERQKTAQEELIRLNLAYEEALKIASRQRVGFNLISQEEAKHFALRLMEQGSLESALRQLHRADTRDDGWYELNGKILMGLRRYEEAHQSYREAIRMDPENRQYRAGALDAVVAQRNSKKVNVVIHNWLQDAFKKK